MVKRITNSVSWLIMAISVLLALHSQAQVNEAAQLTKALISAGDTSWTINTLRAPSSAGANLIGISPSSIQRPTDPSAFMVSLLNATNNLTTIPNSYSVDFAPAWLFAGQHISYSNFKSNSLKNNIPQSLNISFAYKNIKDSLTNNTNTTVGIGLKVSILRGQINSKANKLVDASYQLLSGLVQAQTQKRIQYTQTHPAFVTLRQTLNQTTDPIVRQQIEAKISTTIDSLNTVVFTQMKSSLDSIKKIGETINFTRYGWKLDLAGGLSYYFSSQSFNGSKLNNAGGWITGGYEDETSKVSFLGIARYLYNPVASYVDLSNQLNQSSLHTFDTGLRLLFDSKDDKFTFGGEIIYRSMINNTLIRPSYRYAISTDYQVGKNQLISFAFGRDFNGTINKNGNLLAALNYIIGFGNSKSTKPN